MSAEWNKQASLNNVYTSSIKLIVKSNRNNYLDITNNISFGKATIAQMKSKPLSRLNQTVFQLKIYVKDLEHLKSVMGNLRKYSELIYIERNNS